MPAWYGPIVRIVGFTVISLVLRSPIVVGVLSFVAGVGFYHFYPDQAGHYFSLLLSALDDVKSSIGL